MLSHRSASYASGPFGTVTEPLHGWCLQDAAAAAVDKFLMSSRQPHSNAFSTVEAYADAWKSCFDHQYNASCSDAYRSMLQSVRLLWYFNNTLWYWLSVLIWCLPKPQPYTITTSKPCYSTEPCVITCDAQPYNFPNTIRRFWGDQIHQ